MTAPKKGTKPRTSRNATSKPEVKAQAAKNGNGTTRTKVKAPNGEDLATQLKEISEKSQAERAAKGKSGKGKSSTPREVVPVTLDGMLSQLDGIEALAKKAAKGDTDALDAVRKRTIKAYRISQKLLNGKGDEAAA